MTIPGRKKGAEMFTTTIALPKELYRALQHLALDEDVAVRSLIEEAIKQYLSRKRGGGKT